MPTYSMPHKEARVILSLFSALKVELFALSNFGMPYAKSLEERYDDDELCAMFNFVIHNNETWQRDDEILAEGDYGKVISYERLNEQTTQYGWEEYVP